MEGSFFGGNPIYWRPNGTAIYACFPNSDFDAGFLEVHAVGHVRDSFLQLWFCWNVQRTRLSLQVPHPLSSDGLT